MPTESEQLRLAIGSMSRLLVELTTKAIRTGAFDADEDRTHLTDLLRRSEADLVAVGIQAAHRHFREAHEALLDYDLRPEKPSAAQP